MRARRREINIFNMSLLDILCGALGAFCFMMLVALPYYIPPGSGLELRKAQEETDRLLLAIGKMKDQLPDQKSIEEMEALMQQLEAQVKTLQGRVNMLTAEREEMQVKMKKLADENEDLRGQISEMGADYLLLQMANKELKAKNEILTEGNRRLTALLERKNTFVVAAHSTEFIDLIVTDELNENKTARVHEALELWLKGEMESSMLHSFLSVSGSSTEIKTEMTPEKPQKIFVKLKTPTRVSGAAEVEGAVFTIGHGDRVLRWPAVKLSQERYWALVGTLTADAQYEIKFTEATPEERDAAWQTLTKSTPPPAPTPTPPPSDEALKKAAAARAQRQETTKKFNRLLQISRTNSEAEKTEALALADELIKELPPSDQIRRQAESMRERILADRARAAVSPTP